mgnify:CR=1 FL=1
MIDCLTRTLGNADIFDQFLHLLGWGRGYRADHEGDNEIDKHTKEPDSFWGDPEPIVLIVGQELEVHDVAEGKSYPADHSGNGTLFIYLLGKNTHN